jgi:hypothetical protein
MGKRVLRFMSPSLSPSLYSSLPLFLFTDTPTFMPGGVSGGLIKRNSICFCTSCAALAACGCNFCKHATQAGRDEKEEGEKRRFSGKQN